VNVSDAAFRLGHALRKSKLGKQHKELLEELEKSLSSSALNQIETILSKKYFIGFGNHFYSYLILNDVLNENKQNIHFENDIKEIFSNQYYFKLLEISEKMAEELEITLKNIYSMEKEIKFFGSNNENIPKIRRAVTDLQKQIQRTGFVEWSLENLQDQTLLNAYDKKRDKDIFSKKNEEIRVEMARNKEELHKLNNIETIIMMMDYIKEMIVHSHRDNIIELNLNQVNQKKFITRNNVKIGLIIINDQMIENKSFLIRVIDGYKVNYGIAKNIKSEFINVKEEGYFKVKTTIKVYLLPQNDTNLFRSVSE